MATKENVMLLLVVAIALTSIIVSPTKAGIEPSPFIGLSNTTDTLPPENVLSNTDIHGEFIVGQMQDGEWLWIEYHEIIILAGGVLGEHPLKMQHDMMMGYQPVFVFQAEMIDQEGNTVGNAYAFPAAVDPPEEDPGKVPGGGGGGISTHPLTESPTVFVVYAYASPPVEVGTGTVWLETVVASVNDITPDTLNLKSNGEWISCYIELPAIFGYSVVDIDVSTIKLNNTISVDPDASTDIGDYDEDGIPDLMVKFDRASVIEWIGAADYGEDTGKSVEVTLAVTGEVAEDTFEGFDAVKVLLKG